MTRLLIVTTISSTINAFLQPFAQHFRKMGWQVDALTREVTPSPTDKSTFDHIWNIDWSRDPRKPGNLLKAPRKIRQLLAHEPYDIVHVHTPVASFITRFALRTLRTRGNPVIIYTAHGFHFHQGGSIIRNKLFLGLEKVAGRWTDHLIVINHDDEKSAQQHRLVPPDRIHYMPGIGVNLDSYSPGAVSEREAGAARRALGLSEHNELLLMVAEFIPRKRHPDALQAFAALDRANAHLALAGTGPLLEPMRALSRALGLGQRVHFLGWRQDIPALIRAARATILPSQQEGLPRSVMESLCLATPVIGTNVRGTRELLSTAGGLMVPLGDVAGLARAMAWVLDHPEKAQAMGRQGRLQMQDYDVRHIIALHEELYERALAAEPLALLGNAHVSHVRQIYP